MWQNLIVLGVCFLPSLGFSALPPSAESLRHFKAIVESPAVFEKMNVSDQVVSIHKRKEDYLLMTKNCKIYINVRETDLNQIEPNLIGPPKLDVVITDMKCQKSHPARIRMREQPRGRR